MYGRFILDADVNRNCSVDKDCEHIQGAKCYDDQKDKSKKICDCQPHMVMSANEQICLEIATEPLASCIESIQCSAGLDGAECSEGKCNCRPNFHTTSKKRCVRDKREFCVKMLLINILYYSDYVSYKQ